MNKIYLYETYILVKRNKRNNLCVWTNSIVEYLDFIVFLQRVLVDQLHFSKPSFKFC